jgi:hypothetical protein
MNRNDTLQLSAGIIFALQHHLPTDDYTPYDAQQAQEGLMKIFNSNNTEQGERIRQLERELQKEKETSQLLFNRIGENTMVKNWKKKYVNRNPLCLLCGKDRHSNNRDKYGYCPLLRDCFTCEECGDRKCAKSYNTFNGEHISLGEIMLSRHDEDREELMRTMEAYNDKHTPSFALTEYPNLTTDCEIADMVNEWFKKSIEEPNEIFKLLSYYRNELSICNDTHI